MDISIRFQLEKFKLWLEKYLREDKQEVSFIE